jgi:hypothetical protein
LGRARDDDLAAGGHGGFQEEAAKRGMANDNLRVRRIRQYLAGYPKLVVIEAVHGSGCGG